MSDLLDSVISYEPVVSGVSVPLRSNVIITLLGTDYDETSLLEGFFLEGPSGDQWVGPGILPLEYPKAVECYRRALSLNPEPASIPEKSSI